MDAKTCIQKLKETDVLSFATIGADGGPKVRYISAIHYENDALYVFTARGKHFAHELLADSRVEVLGYVEKEKEMIRLSGNAVAVSEEDRLKWIETIFTEQPYMFNVYPGETRDIGIIFEIKDFEIEYFHLGVRPIFRESYSVGNHGITKKGYRITEKCVSCGTCQRVCPQHCIEKGKPFEIHPEHCLHCGNCFEHCPVKAIVSVS